VFGGSPWPKWFEEVRRILGQAGEQSLTPQLRREPRRNIQEGASRKEHSRTKGWFWKRAPKGTFWNNILGAKSSVSEEKVSGKRYSEKVFRWRRSSEKVFTHKELGKQRGSPRKDHAWKCV
jgi:hypothetical protein